MLWNMRFSPMQAAPFPPVARDWNNPWCVVSACMHLQRHAGVTAPFRRPIYDWDNIFAAYMTSLDNKQDPTYTTVAVPQR